jgi:hypothetical protein
MAYDDLITSSAQRYGLDPQALKRFVQIESGGNPGATTGSYMGLLQLSPSEFYARGGHNIFDPAENLDVGSQKLAQESASFAHKYGRAPDASDLYLIHQQGAGGAAAHMANPSAPAWQNMYSTAEGQAKGPSWAKQAIWGNVPDNLKAQYGSVDNMTSQDFMNLWRAKVNGGSAPDPSQPVASSVGGQTAAPGVAFDPALAAQPAASGAPGGLFGALGVNTSNIGGTGVGITGNNQGAQQASQQAQADQPSPFAFMPLRKPLDMRGIQTLTQQPLLGI